MIQFYTAIIESILTASITMWFGSSTSQEPNSSASSGQQRGSLDVTCHHFSRSTPAGDSSGSSFICEKCKLVSCLTERIIELEVCIRNLEKSRNSERSLESQLEALDASGRVSASSTTAAEPSQRGEWVASRWHRGKSKANAEALEHRSS
ncbi:hypothetical protein NFI96_014874, partial [Prochilodus magdalenae]